MRSIRTISLYSLTIGINAVVALAAIPIIVTAAGSEVWGSVAVGQSTGTIAGVVGSLGWGFSGPNMVARANDRERVRIVKDSIIARAVTLPPICAAASALAFFTPTADQLLSAGAAAATALGATSFSWYFFGTRSGGLLLLADTTPRASLSLAGLALTLATGTPWWFVIGQATGFAAAAVLATVLILRALPSHSVQWSISSARKAALAQTAASVTVVISSTYMSAPVVVVAWLAPSALPQYALADRLARFALTATAPAQQLMQSWVPSSIDNHALRRRMVRAIQLGVAIGGVLFVTLLFGGSTLASLLSNQSIEPSQPVLALMGAGVLFSSVSRIVGSACLLTLDAKWVVATAALVGAVTGLALLIVLVPALGAVGAASAYAIAEALVLIVQSTALWRRWPPQQNGRSS